MMHRIAWVGGVLVVLGSGACSSSDTHPPAASTECTTNCDHPSPGPGGGGLSTGGSGGALEGGSAGSSGVALTGCVKASFGIEFCASSGVCPGLTLDTSQLPPSEQCGFVNSGRGTTDVECLCNQQFLCALTNGADCATLQKLIDQQPANPICSQASTSICADLTQPRDGGTCTAACLQSCAGVPTSCQACGC